jgi:glycosyltransferase involved in cell wall biosynthesis
VFQHLDGVVTLSDLDAEAVRSFAPSTPVVGVAPGVSFASDVRRPTSSVQDAANQLCFLGSLDWVPNVDGLLWFVEMVYPLIRKQVPDVVLHIGGRNPGYDVKALHDGTSIVVHDHVDDAIRFRVDHGINIVPLFSGSGVRIKILESFAASCPVVSTSRGAEGLSVVNGTHLLIEDDHRSFAMACVALLTDASRADALAAAGHQLVRDEFTWDAAITKIMAFCSAPYASMA